MELTIRPMKEEEWKYSYRQSQQLIIQTGSIGCMRADFGREGNLFYTTWTDYQLEKKTERFMAEFDQVINRLRTDKRYGGILKTRLAMLDYCKEHPESRFEGNYAFENGFRVDSEGYAYLLRLNPSRGDYNVYCHCYQRNLLDDHVKLARKGIRFIKPDYQKRFILQDGDKIRIIKSNGEQTDHRVRYIDDYHLEVHDEKGEYVFHISEFAERISETECTAIPIRSSLPEMCFSVSESRNEVIALRRGDSGYISVGPSLQGMSIRECADEFNRIIGVSKRQEAAMLAGALFGWEVSGADPKNLDEEGHFIFPEKKDCDRER